MEIWPSLAEAPIAVTTTNDPESIPRSQQGVAVMNSWAVVTANPPAESNTFSNLLEKFPHRKVLRICSWISRFLGNCRATWKERQYGPLTTAKIRVRELWWIGKTQTEAVEDPEFEKTKVHLNIQPNLDGILKFEEGLMGSTQPSCPVLPSSQGKLLREDT